MNEEVREGEFIKNPRGRPREYSSDMCSKILELGQKGRSTIAAICAQLGIVPDTYYRWKDEYPEFRDAIEEADKVYAKNYWENVVHGLAVGALKGNVTATIFYMCNRYKEDYKQQNSQNDANININLNSHLSLDELDKRIKLKEERIKQLTKEEDN